MKTSFSLMACALVLATPVVAQERVAAGSLQQEASWSALKTLADVARDKANIAQITANDALDRATKIETCGKLGKLYAPGVAGVDANNCKALAATPVQVLVTATGSSSASATCPAGTILTGCTGSRHPNLADTCDEKDCGLIGTRIVGTNVCQVGIDTDRGTAATAMAVCMRY
jgi:hypothetical protein